MKNKHGYLLLLLAIVLLLDLCIIGFELGRIWRYATKTLLIPILITYYISSADKPNKLFVAGLIMSFLGDVFLLTSGGFIAGLSSFLIAHILYMITFRSFFKQKNLSSIPIILIYVIGLVGFLFPYLGALKIPVILYAMTIGGMLYVALGTSNKWLIIGAFLFVLSDSILAVNIFHQSSTIGSLAVMLTYVIAQYFLVQGIIKSSFRME